MNTQLEKQVVLLRDKLGQLKIPSRDGKLTFLSAFNRGSMAEWSACQTLTLESCPGFEFHSDHQLDLFDSGPEFKSSTTLANSHLVCLRTVGILNNVMFNLIYLFQLFAQPH